MTLDDRVDLPVALVRGSAAEPDSNRLIDALLEDPSRPPRLGRYLVLGTLGKGAMGTVLRAFDEMLDRQVALKVLHQDLDELQTSRLVREAQALAKVSHPNVVQVYEVGSVDGQAFVTMELVEGQTLREWMRQEPRPGWRDVVDVFRQLGAGLAAVHERGLVHRDFKPGNAIIDAQGRARVVDFGLARMTGLSEDSSSWARLRTDRQPAVPLDSVLTRTGALMGTPAYMSPELLSGHEADALSDQYSFCVSLYEVLYGERPYADESLQALLDNASGNRMQVPPLKASIPKHLRSALRRGLSADPASRFPSMRALLIALEDFESRLAALNAKMLRLQMALGTSLIFTFWLLDWLVLRQHVWMTLAIRFALCTISGVIYATCRFRPRLAERHVDALTLTGNTAGCWGLVAIIWIDGGLGSYHVAGLNLLVLCVGVMFLWPLRRALVFNALVYASLLSPLLFVATESEALDVVLPNQLFLLSTMLITIAAQHQRYHLQHREFRAEQERRRLEEEVAVIKESRSPSRR